MWYLPKVIIFFDIPCPLMPRDEGGATQRVTVCVSELANFTQMDSSAIISPDKTKKIKTKKGANAPCYFLLYAISYFSNSFRTSAISFGIASRTFGLSSKSSDLKSSGSMPITTQSGLCPARSQ